MIDMDRYPLRSTALPARRMRARAVREFRQTGICILERFLRADAVDKVLADLEPCIGRARVSTTYSTVYLQPPDRSLPLGDPRRVDEKTRVGTLAEDQLPRDSLLHRLYESGAFRRFIGEVVGSKQLYAYADGLTSVNVLIFERGHQLGWHFDEAEYAVTVLLRSAAVGGTFEYAPSAGSQATGNSSAIQDALSARGTRAVPTLPPGSLVLFRGRNRLHRVTPVRSGEPRIVAVLSYDTRPGVRLSEHDRRLFYGRTA